MTKKQLVSETKLAVMAKRFRTKAGVSRAEAGRDLGVSHVSIHRAEENPEVSLCKLRVRMIERYSPFKITGPVFLLEPK